MPWDCYCFNLQHKELKLSNLFPKKLTFLSEAPDIGLLMLSFPNVPLSFLRDKEKNQSDYFYHFLFCSHKTVSTFI